MLPEPTMATDFLCTDSFWATKLLPYSNARRTEPSPAKSATKASPGGHRWRGCRSPAARCHRPSDAPRSCPPGGPARRPRSPVAENGVAAALGHHLAVAGEHSVDRGDVDVLGRHRSGPRTKPAEEALSAMVSHSPIFQSLIRLSINSIAGANAAVAASTSSSVQPAPGRSLARMKPTSTSTRG